MNPQSPNFPQFVSARVTNLSQYGAWYSATNNSSIGISFVGGDDDDSDDSEDNQLPALRLQIELRIFRMQRPNLNESELAKLDQEAGQGYLDQWQRMIISDLPGRVISPHDKTSILEAMIQLSNASHLSPKGLRTQDVGIKDLAAVSETQSVDVDISKGKVGDLDVVVKAPKKCELDDKQLKKYLQQAIFWRSLEHQNVLPFLGLYFLDKSRSRLCVVSPWIENNAQESLQTSRLEHVKGIAKGLEYLHNKGVIHGDLNLSSILIDSAGTPQIGDLGLAQLLGKKTDESEDIYQFGRMFYKIFGVSIASRNGGGVPCPPSNSGVPNSVWQVITKCLYTDPASRPRASEITEALENGP